MTAPAPDLNADLSGTNWIVAAINGAPIEPGRAPQISFGASDHLSGNSGCNNVFAVYEAKNGRMDVRAVGHTERACDAAIMRQEAAFLAMLDTAARYARRGDQLTITDEDGRRMSLNRQS